MTEILHQENGLSFELDKINFTAKTISSPKAKGVVIYPRSINYQSQEYLITSISKNTFKDNFNVFSIKFSEDSELKSICSGAFSNSLIESISIPSKVETLEDGWCKKMKLLNKIYLSPNNQNFKYLNENIIVGKSKSGLFDIIYIAFGDIETVKVPSEIKEIRSYAFSICYNRKILFEKNTNLKRIGREAFGESYLKIEIPASVEELEDGCFGKKGEKFNVSVHPNNKFYKSLNDSIIVGKSNPSSDVFDVIVAVNNGAEEIVIPSTIKKISPFAFYNCSSLKKVVFENDSKLELIGESSFSSTSISTITIPSNVEIIGKRAFYLCRELESINFCQNSKLRKIPKCFFGKTKIEYFTIPGSLESFDNEWNIEADKLKNVLISPENKNFVYLDNENKVLVGKSDLTKEKFDVIIHGSYDIEKVYIPSSIKYIKSCAFSRCKLLQSVCFSEDSEIESFEKFTFYLCSALQSIRIPSSIKRIGKLSFISCHNLKSFEIPHNSQLELIENSSLSFCAIDSLFFPPKLMYVNENLNINKNGLVDISISPENKYFKYLDNEHQMIVGKSDINSDEFDSLLFAKNDIKQAFIPSNIKYICNNAFFECQNLEKIEFEKNSQLIYISNCSFHKTSIEHILIPSHVKYIGKQCFSSCTKLKRIEFDENSEINTFVNNCFCNSAIEFYDTKKITSYTR